MSTEEAMDTLKQAFKDDPDYAHSWHCNIAMMCYDAMRDSKPFLKDGDHKATHFTANDAASRVMKRCFDVETSITPPTE